MERRKIAGMTALAGAVVTAALGLGAGAAQAQPNQKNPAPVPSNTDFTRPPGQLARDLGVAPGQFNKQSTVTVKYTNGSTATISNPFMGVPPGHWDQHQSQWTSAVTAAAPK